MPSLTNITENIGQNSNPKILFLEKYSFPREYYFWIVAFNLKGVTMGSIYWLLASLVMGPIVGISWVIFLQIKDELNPPVKTQK